MTLDEPIRALPGVDMVMLGEKSYVFCVLSWDEVNPEAVCGPVPPCLLMPTGSGPVTATVREDSKGSGATSLAQFSPWTYSFINYMFFLL